ncbi:hypothetical protein ZWY2020_013570 [Hordeum vulgare]|nr:hypothetical protein ZWY2020_013570 [Hordeum vulgare]
MSNATPGTVRRTRLLSALHRNEKLRAAIDWQLVRNRAAEIANTPEFSDLLWLANSRADLSRLFQFCWPLFRLIAPLVLIGGVTGRKQDKFQLPM